jgi:hypothetical protein
MKRTGFGIFWATVLLALLAAAPAAIAQPYNLAPVYPTNGQTGVEMLPNLQWTGEATADLIYRVYLDMDGDSLADVIQKVGPVGSGDTASWQLPMKYALPPDTTCHWRVLAKDTVTMEKTLGAEWSFTTDTYPYVASVDPPVARPTDLVWINGANFGSDQGTVKMFCTALVGYTADDPPAPIYQRVKQIVDGEFGRLIEWTDTQVVIQLAHPVYWTYLPQKVAIKVRPKAPGSPWSNKAKLRVESGGGGCTGITTPTPGI